jgi:uncharacterized protein
MAGTNGATLKVRATRPKIAVGGQDDAALSQRLMSLLVAETVHGLARCEAVFGNWGASASGPGYLYFDRKALDFGKTFTINVESGAIFDGRIMGLEGQFPEGRPPLINVLAEDRLQDLRMTRRTRTFKAVTDADVFRQVAGDHGLTADVNVSGPQYAVLAQVNQSDLAFLRERARSIDAEVWVAGKTLTARARGGTAGPLKLTFKQGLREFTALADLAGQRTAVSVSGWDVAAKDALVHEATESILASELTGMDGGAGILASALGARKELVAHAVPLSGAEARAQAEAIFKAGARRFVTARGVAETEARLRAGAWVDLQKLGPLFSGKYYLTEVRHLFTSQGLRTEFTAERPGLGR